MKVFWTTLNRASNHSTNLLVNFSLDSNILITIKIASNSTGLNFELIPDPIQSQSKLNTVHKFLPNVSFSGNNGNITAGSSNFSGCVEFNVDYVNVDQSACPFDNSAPCIGKSK